MGGSEAVRLRSSAKTSVGQVRENNEDSIHLWASDHFALAVVADGMGGAAAGEQASRIAVEAVENGLVTEENRNRTFLESLNDDFIVERLQSAIRSGNLNIVERAASQPELRGMGTTVTLAFVRHTQAILAHVGDSRAYLVEERYRRITQITADHSFVEALISAGHLTQEQAEEHPMRHVLYRALGQTEDLDVDVYEVGLHADDRLVLCSDGLTRHLKPEEIAQIVFLHRDPQIVCDSLIELANARGGEDNVSVIVILVEKDSDAPNADSTVELVPLRFKDEDTVELAREPIADRVSVPSMPGSPDETLKPGGTPTVMATLTPKEHDSQQAKG